MAVNHRNMTKQQARLVYGCIRDRNYCDRIGYKAGAVFYDGHFYMFAMLFNQWPNYVEDTVLEELVENELVSLPHHTALPVPNNFITRN